RHESAERWEIRSRTDALLHAFPRSGWYAAGYLPGYPASHGCVRMPEQLAIAFYHAVDVGTPVTVFGRTPRTNDYNPYGFPRQRATQPWFGRPIGPGFQPIYDSRPLDPWWR